MPDFNPVVAVEQVTPEWLTQALGSRLHGARVVDLHRQTCGTGQLGVNSQEVVHPGL